LKSLISEALEKAALDRGCELDVLAGFVVALIAVGGIGKDHKRALFLCFCPSVGQAHSGLRLFRY
jgi:hypothetical protein